MCEENSRCYLRQSDHGLGSLESLTADKGSHYDCVTMTDSINRDLGNHYNQQLPGFSWNSRLVRSYSTGELDGQRRVEMKQDEEKN